MGSIEMCGRRDATKNSTSKGNLRMIFS